MLVDSPRLTAADRAEWTRLARLDGRVAGGAAGRLEAQADRARQTIAGFAAAGPCHAGVSWGKDSVIVAHLVATCGAPIPLVYGLVSGRPDRAPNPDAPRVRDAFLGMFPDVEYREVPIVRDIAEIGAAVGCARYVSGVRAAESGKRRMAVRVHGVASANTCRPIAHWPDMDVWAYLRLHDLPVHPAYAASMGGVLDRSRLRVHSFGGEDGAWAGRWVWEDTYWPDVVSGLAGLAPEREARLRRPSR